jgi:hypothetical protein
VRRVKTILFGTAALIAAVAVVGVFAYTRLSSISPPTTPVRFRPPGPPDLVSLDHSPHKLPCPKEGELVQPLETTVCEVVQRPEEFACRRVRLRAALLTDCLDHAVLVGSGCKRGLLPLGAPDPTVDAFFHAACATRPFYSNPKRTATFTGRFRLLSEDRGIVYALEIERIANIRLSPPAVSKR